MPLCLWSTLYQRTNSAAQTRAAEAQERVSTQKNATDLTGFGRGSETLTALKSTDVRLDVRWPVLLTLIPLACLMAGALGLMFAAQWISTNASVCCPRAPGSTSAVKPVMTPLERSRSTRRSDSAGREREAGEVRL
mgnify:CR=1 FL=1